MKIYQNILIIYITAYQQHILFVCMTTGKASNKQGCLSVKERQAYN
jgi:hypothetical protein